MRLVAAILRARPFLILGAVALAAFFVSLTFEHSTSYDDGGIGTISFLVEFTLGLPFLVPMQVVGTLGSGLGPWFGYVAGFAGLIFGITFYVGLDRLAAKWLGAYQTRRLPN